MENSNYPIKFTVEYPEKMSRGLLIVKTLFGSLFVLIPHGFLLFFYAIGMIVVSFIAWWAILFTGKYPKGMFNFVTGFFRWSYRVNAYYNNLTDVYPPFNGKE